MIEELEKNGIIRVSEYEMKKDGHWYAKYKCPFCNRIWETRHNNIQQGNTRSCGCYRPGARTHGKSRTRIYRIWASMLTRCYNSSREGYKNYGERGVKVCDEWQYFENFYEDMGDPPSEEYSLDRINNDGNYCKENCRWATWKEQMRNTRFTIYLTNNDGVTKTLTEWAEITNTSCYTLYWRNNEGWLDQEVIYGRKE